MKKLHALLRMYLKVIKKPGGKVFMPGEKELMRIVAADYRASILAEALLPLVPKSAPEILLKSLSSRPVQYMIEALLPHILCKPQIGHSYEKPELIQINWTHRKKISASLQEEGVSQEQMLEFIRRENEFSSWLRSKGLEEEELKEIFGYAIYEGFSWARDMDNVSSLFYAMNRTTAEESVRTKESYDYIHAIPLDELRSLIEKGFMMFDEMKKTPKWARLSEYEEVETFSLLNVAEAIQASYKSSELFHLPDWESSPKKKIPNAVFRIWEQGWTISVRHNFDIVGHYGE